MVIFCSGLMLVNSTYAPSREHYKMNRNGSQEMRLTAHVPDIALLGRLA